MRLSRILPAIAASALFAAPLFGDWSAFVPRPYGSGAVLDLFGSREEDDRKNGDRSSSFDDTFFKEKLTLFSNGFFYHPRFLYYQLSLTGAFKQEEYRSSFLGAAVPTDDSGLEYDGRIVFLPEHPYNLELFALRYEPLFKEHLATRIDRVFTSYGADFRYRLKPYFFRARYSDDTNESDGISSGVQRLGVNGEYYKQFEGNDLFALNAAYNPSRFDRTDGLEGDSTEALLGNLLGFGPFRLDSRLARYELSQQSPLSGRLETDQLSWTEQMSLDLPAHFRTRLHYFYDDSESRFPGSRIGGPDRYATLARSGQFQLLHQLYQSLDSSYTYRRDDRDSFGGGSEATSHALRFNYNKKIDRGSVLLGASLGRGELHNLGRNDVAAESHPATPVPGSFQLAQTNVDRATIAIYLRSPLAPFENVLLTEGVHYTLTQIGDIFEVDVIALPPQFAVPGDYDFRVAYSLEVGDYRLRSDTQAYSASVHLFDNLLTPFASYANVRSEMISGDFPGTSPDSTTWAGGLLVDKAPIHVRVEYRDVEWDLSPYDEWVGEIRYIDALSPTTNINSTLSYRRREFPNGRPGFAAPGLVEEREYASANLRQLLADRRLVLTIGGSYARTHGLYDTTAQGANVTLSWRVGKLNFAAGANLTDSDTEGIGLVTSSRSHRYYYLRLRRELF